MDRKKITAYLINCAPDEFMAYADQGDQGTVVVGPDGKKFRFSNDQLDQAVIRKKEKEGIAAAEKVVAEEPKPEPKSEPKPVPKKRARA